MNSLTHGMMGGLAGLLLFPGGVLPFLVGFTGGLLPDLDSFFGRHRRTMHYPWLYMVAGILVLPTGLLYSPAYLIALFLMSAGFHSALDALGGGELRSWNSDEHVDEAVYDHLRQEWVRPRRILYSPSPRDTLVAVFTSIAAVSVTQNPVVVAFSGLSVLLSVFYLASVRYLDLVPDGYGTFNSFLRSTLYGGEED